jgi:hypothetical protein
MKVTAQTVGNWEKSIQVPLREAMQMSMEVLGRTGEEVTKSTVILMAQAARSRTPSAKAFRDVEDNPDFEHLIRKGSKQVQQIRQGTRDPDFYFRFRAEAWRQGKDEPYWRYANKRTQLNRIHNAGLAKASWFWPLASAGKSNPTRFVDKKGRTRFYPVSESSGGMTYRGFQLDNRLHYITKIMPSGWPEKVEKAVANRIMGMMRNKVRRDYLNSMKRFQRAGASIIGKVARSI